MSATDAVAHAAAVQAWATVILGFLTLVLIVVTTMYMIFTKRLADAAWRQISWSEASEVRSAADRFVREIARVGGVMAALYVGADDGTAGLALGQAMLDLRNALTPELSLLPPISLEAVNRFQGVIYAAIDEWSAKRITQREMMNALRPAIATLTAFFGVIRAGKVPTDLLDLPEREDAVAWIHERRAD